MRQRRGLLFVLGGMTAAIVSAAWASLRRPARRDRTHQESWEAVAAWRRRLPDLG